MGVIGWLIVGLAAAAITRAMRRGAEPDALFGALLVGVLGALLGGLAASAIGLGESGSFFSVGTWLIPAGSASLLSAVYEAVLARMGDCHAIPEQR